MRYRQLIYRLGLLAVLLLSGLGWFWPSGVRPTVAQTGGLGQSTPAVAESRQPRVTPEPARATPATASTASQTLFASVRQEASRSTAEQATSDTIGQPTQAVLSAVPIDEQAAEPEHTVSQSAAPVTEIGVTMEIGGVNHQLEVPVGTSVLGAMQQLAVAGQLRFQAERSGLGVLVTAIDNQANGAGDQYWFYSVNGTFATVGAAAYILHDGDRISWEYREA